jgi:hypothetical protein
VPAQSGDIVDRVCDARLIHNAAHNGISYQPQNNSPWYILRNQLAGFIESPFKFRTTERSVIARNTIVMWAKMICCSAGLMLPINDGFVGSASDLGAYKPGHPLPTYGPRPPTQLSAPRNPRIV